MRRIGPREVGQRTDEIFAVADSQFNGLDVALLLILAVVLGIEFRQLIAKQLYEASVRRVLKKVSATQRGAYLADVRFRQV